MPPSASESCVRHDRSELLLQLHAACSRIIATMASSPVGEDFETKVGHEPSRLSTEGSGYEEQHARDRSSWASMMEVMRG